MHADHAIFLEALESKHHVTVSFFHVKDQRERTLTCAPLDFGPLRGAHDQKPRYQLWDVGAKRPPYNVTILPEDVRSIARLETTFDPADIIKWAFKPHAWSIERNWGPFS
jgi:hypothetical protein